MYEDCDACYYENGFLDVCMASLGVTEMCSMDDMVCLLSVCYESQQYLTACVYEECFSGKHPIRWGLHTPVMNNAQLCGFFFPETTMP